MPFVTEECWAGMKGEGLMATHAPPVAFVAHDEQAEAEVADAQGMVRALRAYRSARAFPRGHRST